MGIKRLKEDGHFVDLNQDEEFREKQKILLRSLSKAEEICDALQLDISEEMRLKNKLSEYRKESWGVDILEQRIALLFSSYEKD